MPNWCINKLAIYGPEADIDRFKEKAVGLPPWPPGETAQNNILNFHSLVPIPPEVIAAGYQEAGYSWERTNWGAKWGAFESELLEEWEGHLTYAFATAWTPPIAFLAKLGPQWPALIFVLDYEEMGMGFKGICKSANGSFEDHCLQL